LLLLWCRSLSSWRLMYSEEEEQEHRAREPTKATTTTTTKTIFFNEAVRRWSAGGRRKIRGKQRQQQPPSPVISNAPRASPSFSPSLSLSLYQLPSHSRARARYSLADLPCSLGKPLILVWGKPNRQNAIFVRF